MNQKGNQILIKIFDVPTEDLARSVAFELQATSTKFGEGFIICTVENTEEIQEILSRGYWDSLDNHCKVELFDDNMTSKSSKNSRMEGASEKVPEESLKKHKKKSYKEDRSEVTKSTLEYTSKTFLKFENIPNDLDETFLRLSLENEFDTTSFDVKKINSKKNYAIICFLDKKEANDLLRKKKMNYEGKVLVISKYKTEGDDEEEEEEDSNDDGYNDGDDSKDVSNDEQSDDEDYKKNKKKIKEDTETNGARTVEIIGDVSGMEDFLQLYVENKTRPEGIEHFSRQNELLITFKYAKDAESFAKVGHEFSGKRFRAVLLESWPISNGSCAIRIKSTGSSLDLMKVKMLMESQRYGGSKDSVEECTSEDENTCLVVFKDASYVKNILQVNVSSTINFGGCTLTLEVLEPAKPPPIILNEQIDDKKLLFTYLTPKCLEDVHKLKEFVSKISKVSVNYFVFSSKPDKVLTQFEGPPDYKNILVQLCSKPFCGQMISVQKVPQTRSVQLSTTKSLDDELVMLYLEDENLGGGPIEIVESVNDDKTIFVIRFERFEDAVKICRRKQFLLDAQKCIVTPYYESMGLLPPGFNPTKPPALLPDDVTMPIVKEVYGFLLKNKRIINDAETKFAEQYYCKIKWPENSEKCEIVLTWKSPESNQKYFDCNAVKKQAEDELKSFLNKFSCETIKFDQEIFDRFEKVMKKEDAVKEKLIWSKPSKGKLFIVCCGFKNEVDEFKNKLKNNIRKIEEELEIEKQQVTDSIQMPPGKYKFLKKSQNLEKMSEKFEVKIEKFEHSKLFCSGRKQNVKNFKMEVMQFNQTSIVCNPFSSFPMNASEIKIIFSNDFVINELEGQLKDEMKKCIVLHLDEDDLQGYATSEKDLRAAEEILKGAFSPHVIVLDEYTKNFLKKQTWKEFVEKLKTGYNGALIWSISDTNLTFIGLSKNEENLKDLVDNFLKGNVTKIKFVKMESERVEIIDNFAKDDLYSRNKGHVDIKVVKQSKDSDAGFQLMGTEEKVNEIEEQIKELCHKVIKGTEYVSSYGDKILKDDISLKGICHKHKVVIKNLGKADSKPAFSARNQSNEAEKRKTSPATPTSTFKDFSTQSAASLPSNSLELKGTIVSIIKGSIVDQKTDVLFDSCDYKLDLSKTAISRVLSQKAGSELQDALVSAVQTPNLTLGQVVKTKGFNLPCKFVYHGSCFQWNKDSSKSEYGLKSIVKNSLEMATEDKLKSISFPAIGTGKLNVPAVECARIMLGEAVQFAKSTKTSLKEINIVVHESDTNTLQAFLKKLEDLKKRGIESDVDMKSYIFVDHSKFSDEKNKKDDEKNTQNTWKVKDLTLQIVHGDLVKSKTDVIINSTNEKFNVSGGSVSKAIMEKAGEGVIKECKEHGPLRNHMAITSAGNLPHKKIIHLCARNSDGWTEVIADMLEKAEEMQMKSIAMPPLGTRKGVETHDIMASAIVKAVQIFTDNKPKNVKEISIYILDDDLLKSFSKAFSEQTPPGWGERIKNAFSNIKKHLLGDDSDEDQVPQKVPPKSTKSRYEAPAKTRLSSPTDYFIKLEIFSMDEKNIKSAIREIEKKIEEMTACETIALDIEPPVNELDKVMKDFSVRLSCASNKLSIKGEKSNVQRAIQHIKNYIKEKKDKAKFDEEIKLFAKYAIWTYYYDDPKTKSGPDHKVITENYENYSSGTLEKALQIKSSDKITFTDKNNKKHKVDIKCMSDTITDADGSNKFYAKVKRVPREFYKLPERWDNMNNDETHKLIDLDPKSKEYARVENNFKSTSANLVKSVVKIQRIQNPSLYKQYKMKMQSMESNPLYSGKPIELRLWHGTAPTSIPNINSNNFNRSYGGVHGLAYGVGVYFAVNSDYSIRGYSSPDTQGNKYIYQARVLVGNPGQGMSGLKEPPVYDTSKGILYDSVVDKLGQPSMYVIFYDYQMYPEYLITFQ